MMHHFYYRNCQISKNISIFKMFYIQFSIAFMKNHKYLLKLPKYSKNV